MVEKARFEGTLEVVLFDYIREAAEPSNAALDYPFLETGWEMPGFKHVPFSPYSHFLLQMTDLPPSFLTLKPDCFN